MEVFDNILKCYIQNDAIFESLAVKIIDYRG